MTNTIFSHDSAGRSGVYQVSESGVMIMNRRSLFISKIHEVIGKFSFVIIINRFKVIQIKYIIDFQYLKKKSV